MTSSTMIHGVTMRPAIQKRTTTTSSSTPAQISGTAGTRATARLRAASTTSLATRDLVRGGGDRPHCRSVDAHLGARLGDLAQHAVLHRPEADDLLARLGVEPRDALDAVLPLRQRPARNAVIMQVDGECSRERVHLARTDGNLERDLVGQLGE